MPRSTQDITIENTRTVPMPTPAAAANPVKEFSTGNTPETSRFSPIGYPRDLSPNPGRSAARTRVINCADPLWPVGFNGRGGPS